MDSIPTRPIKRLLVANRGEIATRIISTARELEIETFALYTFDDTSHTHGASHSIQLPFASAYFNIPHILQIVKSHKIDTIHPGYGFLSEDHVFSKVMLEEANAVVIGPSWEILSRTGDKLQARKLAEICHVPVLPALQLPTDNKDVLRKFAQEHGYPLIIKAVDGGGGRGIRIVRSESELPSLADRALSESPSGMVFAEKAATDGFRHVEVQIVGDQSGDVRHLWERECSIQRRFQKVVEFAPSSIQNRESVAGIIEAALRMARAVKYYSLGTFEFLANPATSEFYFLEINPRIQVEHTITESICMGIDLVKIQLQIDQGMLLSQLSISHLQQDPRTPPLMYSIQLRVTAEHPDSNWLLSVGKISTFKFPTGNGIRLDTHLLSTSPTIVGTEFDSLLAKIIVTAPSWSEAVAKSKRALADTGIEGLKTNLDALRGIVSSADFERQNCDTQWLERNLTSILCQGKTISSGLASSSPSSSRFTAAIAAPSNLLLRKGDAWNVSLTPGDSGKAMDHHLEITQVQRSEFPASLNASILYTAETGRTIPYQISLSTTNTSASMHAETLDHRKGDASNGLHVVSPFPGRLMEVTVEQGDWVKKGDTVAVVRQMKMEVDIRADREGMVEWAFEVDDEVDIAEGDLIVLLSDEISSKL